MQKLLSFLKESSIEKSVLRNDTTSILLDVLGKTLSPIKGITPDFPQLRQVYYVRFLKSVCSSKPASANYFTSLPCRYLLI